MILEHGENAECRVAEPWADNTLPGCGRLEKIWLGTPSCWSLLVQQTPLCGQHLCPKPLYAQCKSLSAPQRVSQLLSWALVT